MWTVSTHITTATIALLFEQLFASDEVNLFQSEDIQTLAWELLQSLRDTSMKSEISKKGTRIIECLLELRETISLGSRGDFDLEQIISYVKLDVLQHINIPSQTGLNGVVFDDIDW